MSFEDQLSDIFDLDIWELKPHYRSYNQLQTDNKNNNVNLEETTIIDLKQESTVGSRELVYTNNIDSDKVINIFIENNLNISFLNNVVDNLFFNSKVNIYKAQSFDIQNDPDEINIFEKDFIFNNDNLLSIENKKYILSKLYRYADFKSR